MASAPPIEQRLQAMARVIHGVIPGSDIDLLITAPDDWLVRHHRFRVLNDLWGRLALADVSLDLLLYSRSECEDRQHWRSHVIGRAYREGRLLNGTL